MASVLWISDLSSAVCSSDLSGLHPGRVPDPDATPLAPEPGACAGADDCGHRAGGVSPTVPQAPESAGRPRSQGWRDAFVTAVERLNGDIFWAPASKSEDVVTRFGDEARAVFGPIPYGDCASVSARSIPLQVEGNAVDLMPNPAMAGRPLPFEHRDPRGTVVNNRKSVVEGKR